MLKINDKEYKVLTSEIKYASSTVNNQKGFTVLVNIDLEKDNIKGYISFYVDYFKEKTIKIGGKNRHLSVFTPCFDSFQVLFSVVPPLKLVNRYYI